MSRVIDIDFFHAHVFCFVWGNQIAFAGTFARCIALGNAAHTGNILVVPNAIRDDSGDAT